MLLSETEDNIEVNNNGKSTSDLAQSKTLCTWKSSLYGTWEVSSTPWLAGSVHEGGIHNMNMHMDEKSDLSIVPKKSPNKRSLLPAEVMEGRVRPKRNRRYEAAGWTQSQVTASIGLQAVRHAAQSDKRMKFTALLHHISVDLLMLSYNNLKRNAASGNDEMTWSEYGKNLNERLKKLHDSLHKGAYRATPAKRIHIPKADGSKRPLSICCLEDKIVQQAVVYVLNAIYEVDFMGFSYGFRPGRGQHDALDALQVALYRKKVRWVLDTDISKFFDQMDHKFLLMFIKHRIGDRRLLRLIMKWLKVGITEDCCVIRNKRGAPQGAVISPILANIYLHYVHDLWVNAWRKKFTCKEIIVIRYADDTVMGFENRQDAIKLLKELKERLKRFGLELHPKKTRLLRFGRFAIADCHKDGRRKPETFDFLGFTHYCTKSYKNGWFVVARKTIKKRMRAQLGVIKTELRRRINRPIAETGAWLHRALTGHLNYYAVPGNGKSISSFFYRVSWYWLRQLRRRSQRHRMTWEKFRRILSKYFPPIRIIHPQPLHRFDAKTQGRSPVR